MAPLSPYELAVRRAKNWKETVKSLWRTQLTILITVLSFIAAYILSIVLAVVLESPAILFFFGILALVAAIAIYVLNWRFYGNVKDWSEYAVERSDAKGIKLYAISLLINLIAGVVAIVIQFLTTPFTASTVSVDTLIFMSRILGVVGLLIIVSSLTALILQGVGLVKLSLSKTLPFKAVQGAKSLLIAYIINIVYAFIIIGFVLLEVYSKSFSEDIPVIVLLVGVLATAIFYYRGWWLISKSELEVLPEESAETCNTMPQQGNW